MADEIRRACTKPPPAACDSPGVMRLTAALMVLPSLVLLALACSDAGGGSGTADGADARSPEDAGIQDIAADIAADLAPPDAGGASVDADDLTIPAILIRPGGERSVQHLDCVANTAGEAIAVWRETERDGTPQVWTSHLAPGSNDWETPRQLGVRTAPEIDRIGVALDREGRGLVVWNESGGSEDGVIGAFFTSTTGWTFPARVAPGWILSLVSHPDGHATAYGVLEGIPTTLLRYAPASGWQVDTALRMERPGFFFASPRGSGALFWNQPATTPTPELMLSEYAAGAWTAPARLQEPTPFDHPFPMINAALASDGAGLAIWNRGGEPQGDLWASARDAAGWSAPHRLKAGESALWNTTVLINEGGNGLMVWETGNPPRRKIWSALFERHAFQAATMLGEGSEWVTGALTSAGPDASAVVAWSTIGNVILRHFDPRVNTWTAAKAASGRNGGVADLCATIDGDNRARALWISGSPQTVKATLLAPPAR
jgi:hypothetical protein